MLYCPALDELRKRAINMRTYQEKEEFHMDGASAWFHVLTIFGKLLDGFYSPFLQEHGQHTYSQACQSIK